MDDNDIPVSRSLLESLSTDELIKLADTYGVDIPPELERIFIIEELLEIYNTEKQETTEAIKENPSYSETVLLPKQYNISFVEVIVRDPLWVFVFWEIKSQEREQYENAGDFESYYLKVVSLDKNGQEQEEKENSFRILIDPQDNSRYLGFAGNSPYEENKSENVSNSVKQKSECYVIKLGVIRSDTEIPLVTSLPFQMPKLCENENITEMSEKALMRLSGLQDLSIIKNTDRLSRIKRM